MLIQQKLTKIDPKFFLRDFKNYHEAPQVLLPPSKHQLASPTRIAFTKHKRHSRVNAF